MNKYEEFSNILNLDCRPYLRIKYETVYFNSYIFETFLVKNKIF